MTNVLELARKGDAKNVIRDMRVRSLFSPYYFTKTVLGYRKLVDHLHNHDLELFVKRWAQGMTKQGVEWPRAFFKTTTFTIGVGIWGVCPVTDEDSEYALNVLELPEDEWWGRVALHDQDATQLYAFETDFNAKKKLAIVKWHFEENNIFRMCFPEIATDGSESRWTNDCLIIRRVGDRRRDAEGTFEAIGVGGALQSRHYTRVFEDDLVGERARKSAPEMEKTIGWHGRLAGAFESAAHQTRFLISNRWGYADLNSHVRENEPDFVFYTRSALELNKETGEYESIFPEEYSVEDLLAIRDKGSMTRYDFSCQYLNMPTMPGESLVAKENLHVYRVEEVAGRAAMVCGCGARWFPTQLRRYIHYDPYNAKASSKSCPAIVVVGTSPDEHIFLMDYWMTQGSYGQVYEKIFHFNDVWLPQLFTYEDVGHQNATEFHIREIAKTTEYKTRHRSFPRIEGVATGNRAKETRIAESLLPVIEKKKFACRMNQLAFMDQLEKFPHPVLTHDYDLLDALAQGALRWRFPLAEEALARASNEEEEYLKKLGVPYSHCAEARL